MSELISNGSWVQIHQVILTKDERAPQVPEDTKDVPLELRVKGFLQGNAEVGEEVKIKTMTGRILTGVLEDPDPSYEHKFGRPVPEMLNIGQQLREIIREEGE